MFPTVFVLPDSGLPCATTPTRKASKLLEIFQFLWPMTAQKPGPTLKFFTSIPRGPPTVVAGVPPDYFSPTGQLWGNPLYRWDVHQKTNYAWWIKTDSFLSKNGWILSVWIIFAGLPRTGNSRGYGPPPKKDVGFLALEKIFLSPWKKSWEIFQLSPKTWAKSPGMSSNFAIIFKLPGMKIFQFAFASDSQDPFLPHNYPQNCVAYTGTHDNDTSFSWYPDHL